MRLTIHHRTGLALALLALGAGTAHAGKLDVQLDGIDGEQKAAVLAALEIAQYAGREVSAAQARRLYIENTMRLIADVGSTPVAVRAAPGVDQPLDMSHGVLRSVSPIHIEYLQNIGVGASMSLSIVLEGRLWGMLACHHRTPRQVPYVTRAACDVLADLLAAHVQAQLTAEQLAEERMHERLRARLLSRCNTPCNPLRC